MSPVCLIVQPIHVLGLEALKAAGLTPRLATRSDMKTIAREIVDAAAVLTRSAGLSASAMDCAPRLRVIGSHGVGVDEIAVYHATRLGIPVVNTPEANRASVAEYTVALTLSVAKQIVVADAATRQVDFNLKYRSPPSDIAEKTLGIIGFGGIGRRVAQMMKAAFAMDVVVSSAFAEAGEIEAAGFRVAPTVDALLAEADVVSLHRVMRPTFRHMIGARELRLMKPTAILINTARGGLVDEIALAEALRRGEIAGAGLDVFENEAMSKNHPLLSLPNVVLSPHIAGSSDEALKSTALQLVERIVAALAGMPIDIVNPEVWAHRRR